MDRVQTRTDGLLRPEGYTYDWSGPGFAAHSGGARSPDRQPARYLNLTPIVEVYSARGA